MEIKAKLLLQSNIPFDLNFKVKALSKYVGWINPASLIIKYPLVAAAPSSEVKQFKDNTITYSIQILCVFFSIFTWKLSRGEWELGILSAYPEPR